MDDYGNVEDTFFPTDTSFSDYGNYGSPPFVPTQSSNPVTDLVGGLFNRLVGKYDSVPEYTKDGLTGSIFQAIYEFGAGKVDLAKTKAAAALLGSRSPQYLKTQSQLGIGVVILMIVVGLGVFLFARRG